MPTISITRMELLARKSQLNLAQQGRDLLEQKRTALMKEFMLIADKVMEHTDVLQEIALEARQSLARAHALAGSEALRSAALAARAELVLEISTTNVMGVKVPHIEQKKVSRPASGRGYCIVGTSLTVDETASAFEAEVEAILQLAEIELRLTRLANEIQRTSRRLNALDTLLIPRLKGEVDYIQMALDERERADHFRLKRVKQVLERKRMGGKLEQETIRELAWQKL